MNGIPSTKMGAIASKRRVYGPRQNTFRYYRIQFTDNERNKVNDPYFGELQNLTYLNIQSKADGENLLFGDKVTLHSNYFNDTTMAAWLAEIQLEEGYDYINYISMEVGHNPYIEIDFKYPQYVHSYSMMITYQHVGWRILGSHDGVDWHFLQDMPPEVLTERDPTTIISNKPARYSGMIQSPDFPQSDPEGEYLRWGILVKGVDEYSYSTIYTIEFRDGIGGSDLCTGIGGVDKWADSIMWTVTAPFDGNDTTLASVYPNQGIGYKFASPVRPVTIAIRSGTYFDVNPKGFFVICSNNGKLWYYHKYFDTPDGTWPDGSATTQEFEL